MGEIIPMEGLKIGASFSLTEDVTIEIRFKT